MPVAVWLFAIAVFCFLSERLVLSLWLSIVASIDALLEIVVVRRWSKIGSILYEIDLGKREGIINGAIKLLLIAVLCMIAWYLSLLTGSYLERLLPALAINFGQ
jgi:hypothetical protein